MFLSKFISWNHKGVASVVIALLMLLSASIGSSFTASAAPLPSSKPKATWLWDTSLITSSTECSQIIEFAKSQQISRIFMQVNPNIDKNAFRSFIKTAATSSIQIYALDGAPDWVLPQNRERITSVVGWVKSYNASVLEDERFAGIQMDIEPYLLPEWTRDQTGTAQLWLEALSYFHDEVKKDTALTTSAALPFWLEGVPLSSGTPLNEALIGKLDEAALMSYRDKAEEVAALAKEELELGDRFGKKVWLGLETLPASDTPYITFYEEGKAELDRQLARIDELVKAHPSYAGIAVHDYAGWRSLRN